MITAFIVINYLPREKEEVSPSTVVTHRSLTNALSPMPPKTKELEPQTMSDSRRSGLCRTMEVQLMQGSLYFSVSFSQGKHPSPSPSSPPKSPQQSVP